MMYYDSVGIWGWILMTTTMIALLGVLLATGIALYQRTIKPAPIRTEEAYRILAERFARGEIDEAEYLDRLRRLRAHDHV